MMRFNPRQPDAPTGFTLIELLMAMFILALGLVGVVSVFPVSAYLQREALAQVTTSTMTDNVRALLIGRKIDESDLSGVSDTSTDVSSVEDALLGNNDDWPLGLRCLPAEIDVDGDGVPNEAVDDVENVSSGDPEDSDFDNRSSYWVPLVRDADDTNNSRDWEIYVVILARQGDGTYDADGSSAQDRANDGDPDTVPKVVRYDASTDGDQITITNTDNDTLLQPGDQFLTEDGRIMTVATVAPGGTDPVITVAGFDSDSTAVSAVWCAPYAPNSSRSPTQRILAFGSEAVK